MTGPKTPKKVIETVVRFVERNGSITNRECREILNLSYDNSIKLLGGLSRMGVLRRHGVSSATKYLLSKRRPAAKIIDAFTIEIGRLIK